MPIYDFTVRRSGNLTVPCSVPWALEGTGAEPINGSWFEGGVLPSGLASFAAGAELSPQVLNLRSGDRPLTRKNGRLVLRNPVDCRIDPNADQHSISIPPGETEPPPPPPPSGDLYEPIPLGSLPTSRRTNVSSAGTRTGQPGENFVLTQNITGGILDLRGSGRKDEEIVFRGDSDSSSGAGLRVLKNVTISLSGSYCVLARVALDNCVLHIEGSNCVVCRSELGNFVRNQASDAILRGTGRPFSFHKNDVTTRLGPIAANFHYKAETPNYTFARNLFEGIRMGNYTTGQGRSTFIWYPGSSEDTSNINMQLNIYENLIYDCPIHDIIEAKVSNINVHDNTIELCDSAGLRTRHGRYHEHRRNLFVRAANAPLITARTGPHEITENQFWTQGGEPGGGKIDLWAGKLHWDYDVWKDQREAGAENNWQASGHQTVVANYAEVRVGVESGPSSAPPEIRHGYLADGNNVGPTSGPSRNRVVTLTQYQVRTVRNAVAGYDIDVVLPWLKRADVGLRAP